MNSATVLGLQRKELFDFFILTLDLLYEKDQIDTGESKLQYENFFNESPYIDPLPGAGASYYYSGKFSSLWFDSDREVKEAVKEIEEHHVFMVLSKSASIRSAFDAYSKLPLPNTDSKSHELDDAGKAYIEKLKASGQPQLVDDYLERRKRFRFQRMDFHRFVGLASINYAIYLFDAENVTNIRANQKTPAQIRDALLGTKPKSSAKSQSRNGPLFKLIELIESGHGLIDSSQNMELLNLLKKLGLQAMILETDQKIPSVLFDKRFHTPAKRFVLRIGSRTCSEFRYDNQKESIVELMIYHLFHAMRSNKPEDTVRDADLRKQITRNMQPFYDHKNALYDSWASDHIPPPESPEG